MNKRAEELNIGGKSIPLFEDDEENVDNTTVIANEPKLTVTEDVTTERKIDDDITSELPTVGLQLVDTTTEQIPTPNVETIEVHTEANVNEEFGDSEELEETSQKEKEYRPKRNAGRPDKFKDYDTNFRGSNGTQIRKAGAKRVYAAKYRAYHTSLRKGLNEYGKPAYQATVKELKQMLRGHGGKDVMTPVYAKDLSKRQLKKRIRSLMFLKTKFDALGRFEKIKARLVGDGRMQDRNMYPDTFSPTVQLQSLFTSLVIAVSEGRKVCALDIGAAYLNAERTSKEGEELIMELEPLLVSILKRIAPEVIPYVDENGKLLVKLNKALYGTLDAAKLWYEKLTGVLTKMGFVANLVDPCVMNKTVNGKQLTVILYVDDLLLTCENDQAFEEVISGLKKAFGDDITIKSGKDLSYLGMHLNIQKGKIIISMEAFIDATLTEYKVTGKASSPATGKLFQTSEASALLGKDAMKNFHSVVAKLLYLATRVRPDILLAIAFLATRVKAPTFEDQGKLERVLKYLNNTKGKSLVFEPRGKLVVEGFIDAAFGCHQDSKGHTGTVVTVAGCMVKVSSSKQKIVTKDSTESELVGLSDKFLDVIQCNDFLRSQGYEMGPPVVHQDNQSAITLVTKGGGKYRTKYLRARQARIREQVQCGELKVSYLSTRLMLADILTKPLQGTPFKLLSGRIMNGSEPDTGVRRV
jgi:hypothetical protein